MRERKGKRMGGGQGKHFWKVYEDLSKIKPIFNEKAWRGGKKRTFPGR